MGRSAAGHGRTDARGALNFQVGKAQVRSIVGFHSSYVLLRVKPSPLHLCSDYFWLLCSSASATRKRRSPCSAGALRLIVVCAARSAPSTSRNMVGAALQALHNRDPFRLRAVASALHLPEWLVACLTSLLLTMGMSLIQLLLVAPLLRAALRPVFAMSAAVTGLDAPPVLQPFWTSLINHKPFAEVVSMPVFPGLMSAIYYFLSCLPFAIVDLIDSPSFRSRFKHQPEASQKSDAWYCALFLTGWHHVFYICLLYTSPSPRDRQKSRMPSSA